MPRNIDREKRRKVRKANERPVKKEVRARKRLRKKEEQPIAVECIQLFDNDFTGAAYVPGHLCKQIITPAPETINRKRYIDTIGPIA